jgi:cytidine deaminase
MMEQAVAVRKAYAPYSKFSRRSSPVRQWTNCSSNQENAAYPSGLCAERVAIFSRQVFILRQKF